MSHCPWCGAGVAATDRFCGACGRPPAQVSATPFASWDPPPHRGSTGPWIGIGLSLLALAAAATWWVSSTRGPADPALGASASATASASGQAGVSPSSTSPTPTSLVSSVSPTSSAPSEPTTTPGQPRSGGLSTAVPAETPTQPTFTPGVWLLVLDSLDQAKKSRGQAEAQAARMGQVMVIDSTAVPGLRPGYWAIISSRTYASSGAARSDCATYGRSASDWCYPRQVTG